MANTKNKFGKNEENARWNYLHIINLFPIETLPADTEKNVEIFTDRVNKQLSLHNFTQAWLAEESGISPQALSKILSYDQSTKVKNVNRDRARLFAAILRCTPHYLLGLTDAPMKAINLRGEIVEVPYSTIPRAEIAFSEYMKKSNDVEFVKCICEIVAKSNSENDLMRRVTQVLVAAFCCDPQTFKIKLPHLWHFDET